MDQTEGGEHTEMFFRVVCHCSPFLLSTGRQIDIGRRTSTEAGRQGEGDWCGRKAVYSTWATVPPSWLGLVNQASPPGPIFHSQTFTTACSPACDEKGCCHRGNRSCGMSLSDQGFHPSERGHWSVPSCLCVFLWATCPVACQVTTSSCQLYLTEFDQNETSGFPNKGLVAEWTLLQL